MRTRQPIPRHPPVHLFALVVVALVGALLAPASASAGRLDGAGAWPRAAAGRVITFGGLNQYGETDVPAGLAGVIQVAASPRHTVALKSDGTVVAWGDTTFGQAAVPAGLRDVAQIAAGCAGYLIELPNMGVIRIDGCHGYTLAVGASGRVIGWGDTSADSTPVPADLTGATQVAVGGSGFKAALKSDGTVVGWGQTWETPWADPDTGVYQSLNAWAAGLSDVVRIAAGGNHLLALRSDGTVVAWGDDYFGQADVPAGLSRVVQIAAGPAHSYALKDDGTVIAWGWQQPNGPLGISGIARLGSDGLMQRDDGSFVGLLPAEQEVLGGASWLVAAGDHYIAIMGDETVAAYWEHQNPSSDPRPDRGGVAQIAIGEQVELVLKADGTLMDVGGLPIPADLHGVTQVAAGRAHAAARKSDGTVVAWGDNSMGQASVPQGLSAVVQVAAGRSHTVALKSDGTVVAWGDNSMGQASVPQGLSAVVQVAAGKAHTVALKSDGTVVAWGDNSMGQASVPGDINDIIQVAAGDSHTALLKSDGTVTVLFGVYVVDNMLSPPPDLSGVVQIAAGDQHTVALLSDGSIFIWGWNPYLSPLQYRLQWLRGVFQVAAGAGRVVALQNVLNSPPTARITASPARNSSSASITFTGSDAETSVASFECSLDEAPFAPCASPHELNSLADGPHTFAVRAIDTQGAVTPSPDQIVWVVDTLPPETTIAAGPSNPTSDPLAVFTLLGTDGEDAIQSFQCRLDGEAVEPCGNTLEIPDLAMGNHTLLAAAVDEAGNIDPTPAEYTWVVSAGTLDTTITVAPNPLTASRAARFEFVGIEMGSGLSGFRCSLDGAAAQPCGSPVVYDSLGDGAHSFAVQALDAAGSPDLTPATYSWTVDATPPDTTMTARPDSPSGSDASFSFEGTDATSGLAGFTCVLDGAAPQTCEPPVNLSGLADGSHTFAVAAVDTVGNQDPEPASYTWVVGAVATSTSFAASPNPTSVGQIVTLVATVSTAGGGVAPAGLVSFSDGGAPLAGCAEVPLVNGAATCTLAFASAGNHLLGASYGGGEGYGPSVAPTATLVVRHASQTTLATTLSPSPYGQSVSLVATVSAARPAGGNVTFLDGAKALGTRSLSNGKATLTTAALGGGAHAIVAVYNGSSTVGGSVSAALNQVISPIPSSATLGLSASQLVIGHPVTLSATVVSSPPGATVTGTVTFRDGESILGSRNLSGGKATLTTSALALGAHRFTASFNATANLLGSVSAPTEALVGPAETTTSLTASTGAAVSGQKITFSATVRPVAPGAGTPTGSVTFFDGVTVLGAVNLSGGRATLASALPLGPHTISALYTGTPSYNGSTAAPVEVTLGQAATTTTLTTSANPSLAGKRLTFKAIVRPVAPGAGIPTGSVTFFDGATVLGTINLSSGRAILATVTLAKGSHTITAAYSGEAGYGASTSPVLTQTVN